MIRLKLLTRDDDTGGWIRLPTLVFGMAAQRKVIRANMHGDRLAIDLQFGTVRVVGAARGQAEAADRGDRRQCLAAETQRGHRFQVIERGDLAGGVATDRQWQFTDGNVVTILADRVERYFSTSLI